MKLQVFSLIDHCFIIQVQQNIALFSRDNDYNIRRLGVKTDIKARNVYIKRYILSSI